MVKGTPEPKPNDLSIFTDDELQALRDSIPKYKNHQTPEQQELDLRVYVEQKKRYDADISRRNREAMDATGLKHGDNVTYTAPGAFGMVETYVGKVSYNKNGKLVVRASMGGKRYQITPIHKGWRKIN